MVSVTEFNEIKNEQQNLTHLMTVLMRKFDSHVPSQAVQDSGSLASHHKKHLLLSICSHDPYRSTCHNQYLTLKHRNRRRKCLLEWTEKLKTRSKSLRYNSNRLKGFRLGSVNFSDLCISSIEISNQVQVPGFREIRREELSICSL